MTKQKNTETKKQSLRKFSCKIKPQTYYHIYKILAETGEKYPGKVIDKIMRSYVETQRTDKEYYEKGGRR